LSAILFRESQSHPAAIAELGIGVGKARRGDNAIVRELRPGFVADSIQWRQHIPRQLVRLIENRGDQIGIEIREGAGGG
jgi:hypothetical protein